jgi:hypothetical protein
MKVFELKSDFDFQAFYPYDPKDPSAREIVKADILIGTGVTRLSTWKPRKLFAHDPSLKRGNFGHLWGFGGFVVDSLACELLASVFAQSCELLPFLPTEEGQYYRLNLLAQCDCLDQQKTKWLTDKDTGENTAIKEFHFDPRRISLPSLFRIPEDVIYLSATGLDSPDAEFKTLIERHELTGLKFKEIWSEDGPAVEGKPPFASR